jgi:hypothetical protein
MAAPITAINEQEPKEPPLCLAESFTWQEVHDGYAVFTDYGAKSYVVFSTANGIEVHEEALPDRSNCLE